MKIQNLCIALATSVLAVSSNPSWVTAAKQSTPDVHRQSPSTLIAQMTYGTNRTNRTCPSRVNPQRGAISLEQAKAYFICRYEVFKGRPGKNDSYFTFVDDLKMQMAAARPPNGADRVLGYKEDIDLKQPVYPIKVSYTSTFCGARNTGIGGAEREGQCIVTDDLKGVGACFRSTFGEWHCITRPMGSSAKRWATPRD